MKKTNSSPSNPVSDIARTGNDAQEIVAMGIGVAIVLCVLMILVGAVVVQLSGYLPNSIKGVKKLGEIGDFLGGVLNPVVALMALFALFRSIEIQRTELKATNEALKNQGQAQNRDRAERTFFELLSLRSNIIASIEWTDPQGKSSKGRAALKTMLEEVNDLGTKFLTADLEAELKQWDVSGRLNDSVKPFVATFAYRYTGRAWSLSLKAHQAEHIAWPTYEPELGHVFRATYQLLKFIHKQPLFSRQDKEDFTNYLRAQMSEDEFVLFALTGLTSIGKRSRAAAIATKLFEDRLQSTNWAIDMRELFASDVKDNCEFARTEGFYLEPELPHAP